MMSPRPIRLTPYRQIYKRNLPTTKLISVCGPTCHKATRHHAAPPQHRADAPVVAKVQTISSRSHVRCCKINPSTQPRPVTWSSKGRLRFLRLYPSHRLDVSLTRRRAAFVTPNPNPPHCLDLRGISHTRPTDSRSPAQVIRMDMPQEATPRSLKLGRIPESPARS